MRRELRTLLWGERKKSVDKIMKNDMINGLEDLVKSKNAAVRLPEVVIGEWDT